MGVKRDLFVSRQHRLNPNDAISLGLCLGHSSVHFCSDFWSIRSSSTEDNLIARRHVVNRVHEVNDPFLASDAAYKKDERFVWVDAVFTQHVRTIHLLIFIKVDSVVNDLHFGGIYIEESKHIHFGLLGDSDHGICHLNSSLLKPDSEVIAAPELLAFPRPEWLQ